MANYLRSVSFSGRLLKVVMITHCRRVRNWPARALCLAAVSRVSELGGTEVAVHARGDEAYPVPRRVYEGCGFRVRSRTVTFGG